MGVYAIMDARIWIMALTVAMLMAPATGTGLSGSGSCQPRNDIEAYCIAHGGCPREGYCYFPDGGYCELLSFYNGTCPGEGYYEQAAWMAEAYRFLYGDTGYYYPYSYYPYYYPYYYYSYSNIGTGYPAYGYP